MIWKPDEAYQQHLDLFEEVTTENQDDHPINNFRGIDEVDIEKIKIPALITTPESGIQYTENTRNGYIKLVLSSPPNAFGHKEYPEIISRTVTENLKRKGSLVMPNEPYTPQIKKISIDYSLTHSIRMDHKADRENDLLFYVNSLSTVLITPESRKTGVPLVPNYTSGSEIYFRIENHALPQTLSMLFQISDFTNDVQDFNAHPEWSYLTDGLWKPIEQNSIISDTTNQLSNSGIILFDFIEKINTGNNILLENNFLWLRCKTIAGHKLLENLIDVKCQAVSVSFFNQNNSLSHLRTSLPPFTINNLAVTDNNIQTIIQPYDSFEGKERESESRFYVRVSERLKHKNRAVVLWDYENLILEAFDDIQKVICLNNTDSNFHIRPGYVALVVLPKIQKKDIVRVSEPIFPTRKLKEIHDFILRKTSPFVNISIRNPLYERVKTKFSVKYREGFDEKYCTSLLNEELIRFVSPWLFDKNKSMILYNQIRVSKIIYFIEKLEFVDFITNFTVYHIVDGIIVNHSEANRCDSLIKPTTPISVLISADEHTINPILSENVEDSNGVDQIILESDFIIETELMPSDGINSGIDKFALEIDFYIEGGDMEDNLERANYLVSLKNT
jgi:hypothetical protein